MRATVRGVELHYDDSGDGEPLLLVHGFPLSRRMWDDVVPRLDGRWRAIAPDLRGHGESAVSESTSMRLYAGDLAALLDELGEKRPVVIVGMSMGGYIALEFYRRHPKRVRALVLADTRATRDTPQAARVREETAAEVLRDGSQVVAEGMVERLFAPSASPELREQWKGIMAATPPAGAAAALRAMAARPDSRRLLKRLAVPVLAIVGAEDVITPASDARAIAEAAPDGRVRVISRAGHMSPVEQPAEFAAILRDFLSDL
ncbi:MAG: alpha/beta fold hydrolase [Gemmatimonadetes bacterium]|nr:alpha/beta fold hydrolase [Gemmatimonadota bacterium]